MLLHPENASSPTGETIQTVRRLLDELSGASPSRRQAAERELQAIGIESAFAIQEMYKADVDEQREALHMHRKYGPWLNFGIVLLGVLPIVMMRNEAGPLAGFGFMVSGLVGMVWYHRKHLAKHLKRRARVLQAQRHLCKMTDKCTLPILMDLQALAPSETLPLTLVELLSKLDAHDTHLLSGDHLSYLNRSLSLPAIYPDERIVILGALSKVGGASSIPFVKRMAYARFDDGVRTAACECLESLERRTAVQGQTLLRPAPATDRDDALLRAASATACSQHETLLRPTDAERRSQDAR